MSETRRLYVLQIVYTTEKGYSFIHGLRSKVKLLRLNFHVGKKFDYNQIIVGSLHVLH